MLKKKKIIFLFVGNRNGYKNFSFLVDGLSKFKKFRDNFDLYLFGGSNFSNYEISKFKEKGIYKNIRFCGNDESILSSLYKNSCFIYHLYMKVSVFQYLKLCKIIALSYAVITLHWRNRARILFILNLVTKSLS